MKIKTINNNFSKTDFNSCLSNELAVIAGGYIITPLGEIIVVQDEEEHRQVFSKYINSYLELQKNEVYTTFQATKMLCELGCCVYSGVRLEYAKNKLETLDNSMGSMTFPNNIEELTNIQKELCQILIKSNKSVFNENEKIYIQYGSFPDNVYTKEQVLELLNKRDILKKE